MFGIQSYAQLEDIYGVKPAATLFDVMNTRAFFRSPSREIAEFAAGEIGEKEILKASEQYSYGADPVRDGVSTGKEKERETLVSYSDIQTLPDLSCYVTLPGPYPAVKLALKYKPRPKIAEGFIQRTLDTRVDTRLSALWRRGKPKAVWRERCSRRMRRSLNSVMQTARHRPDSQCRKALRSHLYP